jgi:hypothetical protein
MCRPKASKVLAFVETKGSPAITVVVICASDDSNTALENKKRSMLNAFCRIHREQDTLARNDYQVEGRGNIALQT